ncbi:MAG: DUF4032 domain-containing protein [Candidatus Eisenbacteria bacterium]|uniref:DUF4032 domain-containing protein n=1 Tax=Eiseniibacteriota bacterium TaxID=2212470 RepID=A0A849SDD6_UNCEI|nr:DUF4032 domain-containing protein [Candidatus Eisenbacteria bacterium]
MNPAPGLLGLSIRQDHPDFLDLPWGLPLARWAERTARIVQVPRGLSRHEVVFVSYGAAIYAMKELPEHVAEREYETLRRLEERGLPAVLAVGSARVWTEGSEEAGGVLVTRFLDGSLPYRALFRQAGLERYRDRLLDAMASLIVRLHLGGCFWGDCSLSNTLFRRDAGELQAFLVDAETSEVHESLSDGQREQDLVVLEENVAGDLADVSAESGGSMAPGAASEVVEAIRARYQRLWGEIAREIVVAADEGYRIHERIRVLNDLGFSVDQVELVAAGGGDHLRMRTIVTDRDYHRHQLHSLTGVVAGEEQARLMMQEIRELRATLSRATRSTPMSVAAFHWLDERFHPTLERLAPLVTADTDTLQLYCEVLEHKWYMSERAKRDVGLEVAVADYIEKFGKSASIALES